MQPKKRIKCKACGKHRVTRDVMAEVIDHAAQTPMPLELVNYYCEWCEYWWAEFIEPESGGIIPMGENGVNDHERVILNKLKSMADQHGADWYFSFEQAGEHIASNLWKRGLLDRDKTKHVYGKRNIPWGFRITQKGIDALKANQHE